MTSFLFFELLSVRLGLKTVISYQLSGVGKEAPPTLSTFFVGDLDPGI
ncbi:MAG: hypothetical protein KME55_30470 [Nostoc indistinguendum CM1-VF10]|jgi:hypothetical protein|nr:hypothetical protein [Nostoc indistinguendum CM1-VF10]